MEREIRDLNEDGHMTSMRLSLNSSSGLSQSLQDSVILSTIL